MRALLMLMAALLLAACAAQPLVPASAGGGGFYAEGTLASVGSVEYELAPLYTRNAALRRTAARRLDAGRIGVNDARAVQSAADEARALLDAARTADAATRAAVRDEVAAIQARAAARLETKR